ncbi:hypothetical protein CK203_053694 [Vitis vinifera]|uniref:Uncharacterized protein n=1 Tax=Vitis vinifera TaxID=29760 RepID=A0A438GS05_VITVI|nr:hypothetical protein CK203_053694 [Vitis vinifera]
MCHSEFNRSYTLQKSSSLRCLKHSISELHHSYEHGSCQELRDQPPASTSKSCSAYSIVEVLLLHSLHFVPEI